ncbi:MAG: hypothetical protein K2P18_02130 [Oscillospiraceae bacterium]|nr:hypothetical protein [Oscillospiraceae bacterium]
MDQEKNPVDLLDEILNRGQEEPRPSSYPPKFDPPLPENEPPPPEQKAPLRERAVPWLCGLLGGAAVTGLLCAVLLTSLNQRLDQLGAAVDEIQAVDELRKENERLLQENADLQAEVDEQSSQLSQHSFEQAYRYQRMVYRMRQSEYLYYMEQFVEQDDLSMAALVMVLEDGILRPPGEDEPERIVYGGAMPSPLGSIQQERYDEVRRLLEEKGVLSSSGMTKKNGTTPLWPPGTGPSEDPAMAVLGILWCAMDQYYVRGNLNAATQFLVDTPLNTPDGRGLLYRSGRTVTLYHQLVASLSVEGCLREEADTSLAWNPVYGHTDEGYNLPFELPPLPWGPN